ncbi:MAG TPA: DUF5996 family protein [Flavipsychrobacter sp.]|nr:DUF5996 family protein [Flavipsychrobacter sp.]
MNADKLQSWPVLVYEDLNDTLATVQLWTQIVGKIRLRNMPWINHSWHVTLYVSPRGLTTGSIPYEDGVFEISFDFVNHKAHVISSFGNSKIIDLYPRTVASFYKEIMSSLKDLGINTFIYSVPNEIEPAIPFEHDEIHCTYDADQMYTYWKVLVNVHNIFTRFRAGFRGKCSPVHLFWGAFDLAVTRFSGRAAPKHEGSMPNLPSDVMQEAYSHEVSSCGFWPGNEQMPQPVFYSYCYPTPDTFGTQNIAPKEAFFSSEMGEFILPYEVVRQAPDPGKTLLQFLQSTYVAATTTGNWDRSNLECDLTSFEK